MQSLDSFFESLETRRRATNANSNRLLQLASPSLEYSSTEDIVAALRVLRAPAKHGKVGRVPNRHLRIVHLVKYLVRHREYPLDAFVYECMMEAMTDPKGSAKGVSKILDDMVSEGVSPTAAVCYSALEALTVHPDYVLRLKVIEMMQKYWFEFTVSAKQNIVVGMLRDGQFELAFTKLMELSESKERVELWVYDVFIVEFGRVGFLDEVLELLQKRKHAKGTDDAFRSLLLHALDLFSQAYHHEGTTFAWDCAIGNYLHNPPRLILENVLGTAARHGDEALARDAFGMLSSKSKPRREHYEALADTLVAAGDMTGALGTLCDMKRAGLRVRRGSTRVIHQTLKENTNLLDEAAAALLEKHKEGVVPLEAVAVMVETMAIVHGSEAAMPLYHDIFFLTGERPNRALLRSLILHSTDTETQWTLAKDYSVLVPEDERQRNEDKRVYNVLIPACAEARDFDLAFELAKRAMVLKPDSQQKEDDPRLWREAPWVEPLIDLALQAEDARVWPVVDELDRGHDDPAKMVRLVLERRRMQKKAEEWRSQKEGRDGQEASI
ncbi:hypothetical protein ACJ41O_008260 [Fusarium nematophilum]